MSFAWVTLGPSAKEVTSAKGVTRVGQGPSPISRSLFADGISAPKSYKFQILGQKNASFRYLEIAAPVYTSYPAI